MDKNTPDYIITDSKPYHGKIMIMRPYLPDEIVDSRELYAENRIPAIVMVTGLTIWITFYSLSVIIAYVLCLDMFIAGVIGTCISLLFIIIIIVSGFDIRIYKRIRINNRK